MKKIVFWVMMTLGVVSLQSCDKDDDNRLQVSANLQEAFDTRYPNVSRVDWEQKGQFYEAEFVDNGYENSRRRMGNDIIRLTLQTIAASCTRCFQSGCIRFMESGRCG